MMKNIKHLLLVFAAAIVLYSCSPAEGNYPGSEYMPDMAHSVAQESNVYDYYYYNTWDSASVARLKDLPLVGKPVKGTIPRGYAGAYFASQDQDAEGRSQADVMAMMHGEGAANGISVPVNGAVPYYYTDTEAERTRAIAELKANPFPITADGLARGEVLYNTFCGICHGVKGDGVGYLVSEENPNAVYPAAPANFLLDEFLAASNGRYYHSIMFGKNVMGAYADKISYEERWQVIHWIRALQAKEKKLEYSASANTLNPEFGTPATPGASLAESATDDEAAPSASEEVPAEPAAPASGSTDGGQGKK